MSQIEWTLKGRVVVVPQLNEVKSLADIPSSHGDAVPLRGIEIRVSAKQFDLDPSGWETWATGETDASGRFELRHTKNQTKRLFRIEAMFKDDELKIYPPNSSLLGALADFAATQLGGVAGHVTEELIEQLLNHTTRLVYDCKWLTIYESDAGDKREPSLVDFGTLPFASTALFDRNDFTARRHAEIWYVVKRVMALLESEGLAFRRDRPVAVLHPHDNSALPDAWESSYSNPYTDIMHLVKNARHDHFNVDTIVHELMHLWAYQNVRQEDRMATYLLTHFDTHSGRLAHWVAWHEAFAECMSNEMIREIFGTHSTVYNRFDSERRPYSRPFLKEGGMSALADLDFFEDGWAAVFGLLLNPQPCNLDMTVPGPYADSVPPPAAGPHGLVLACESPRIGWQRILESVAGAGTQKDGSLDRGAMRMVAFFRRVADQVPAFTVDYQAAFAAILDPTETRTARALLTSLTQAASNPAAAVHV